MIVLTVFTGKVDANLSRVSKIFQQAGGVEKVGDLIEHYMDVGYDHLVPSYVKYNWSWIEYYNADIKLILVLGILCLGYLVRIMFSFFCCRSVKQKQA